MHPVTENRTPKAVQPVLRLDSWFRTQWVVRFRGYRIYTVTEEPKQGLFGNVRLVRHWLLCKAEE